MHYHPPSLDARRVKANGRRRSAPIVAASRRSRHAVRMATRAMRTQAQAPANPATTTTTTRIDGEGQRQQQVPSAASAASAAQPASRIQSTMDIASSVLTLLGVSARPLDSFPWSHTLTPENEFHHRSPYGTLGPSTQSHVKFAAKGERTLTRSRLEVCPAIASFIASLGNPLEHHLRLANEPTPIVSAACIDQKRFNTVYAETRKGPCVAVYASARDFHRSHGPCEQ